MKYIDIYGHYHNTAVYARNRPLNKNYTKPIMLIFVGRASTFMIVTKYLQNHYKHIFQNC